MGRRRPTLAHALAHALAPQAPTAPADSSPQADPGAGGRRRRRAVPDTDKFGVADSAYAEEAPRYDLVLVYPRRTEKRKAAEAKAQLQPHPPPKPQALPRGALVQRLRSAGLAAKKSYASEENGDEKLLLVVGATRKRLLLAAEATGMRIRLEEVPAALRRFEFHSSERACLLDTLLETDAGVELGECYKNTDLERVFLLHDEAERLELEALLGEGSMVRTDPLPLRHIEAYLGPEYAFYFAFLFRLTRAFWLPATLGVVLFAVKQDFGGSGSDADWLTPAYALLLMVWATAFVETWKRSENTLMLDWDLDARLPRPHVRHEFECEFRRGIHSQSDEFVGIAEEELPASAQAPLTEMTEASLPRRRSCYSCAVLSLFLGATIIGTLGLVVLRFIATELGGVGGTFDAALAMALFVEAMSYVYDKAAYMLTGWENHRTYATYRDSLILKLFTYSFINKTFALFYMHGACAHAIGFGKGRTARLFGRSYVEPCLDWAGNETDSCMDELRTQMNKVPRTTYHATK
ncbi:calcium-activated chloride channel-domain-containing protein [Pavlovales sp. CCMP2436]|nr:calcium-activated chloride channel-domain-containing protein [Pavlovales sp. CCMP2436]